MINTRKRFSLLLLLSVFSSILISEDYSKFQIFPLGSRQNSDPVVLVHGILGFGRSEGLGIRYWGIFTDFEEILNKEHHTIYTAAVGPISSNWDRACELFAVIRGGTVDYGAHHARQYGHSRFGRTYPGLYPIWGRKDKNTGKINRIHLLCHSMGGVTARVLIHLLENGAPDEWAQTDSGSSLLFKGGNSWVNGCMTINSPHDGSTQLSYFSMFDPESQYFWSNAICLSGSIYDFKLDQWDLQPKETESFLQLYDRVLVSGWQQTEDSCYPELTVQGARKQNAWIRDSSKTYYFSWASKETHKEGNYQVPDFFMNPLLHKSAIMMGTLKNDSQLQLDSSWLENDGVINTRSMIGPNWDTPQSKCVVYDGIPKQGMWNFLGCIPNADHIDVIGFCTPPWFTVQGFSSLLDWYRYNIALLESLPE